MMAIDNMIEILTTAAALIQTYRKHIPVTSCFTVVYSDQFMSYENSIN
jgi:hypothetical protein